MIESLLLELIDISISKYDYAEKFQFTDAQSMLVLEQLTMSKIYELGKSKSELDILYDKMFTCQADMTAYDRNDNFVKRWILDNYGIEYTKDNLICIKREINLKKLLNE